MPGGGCHRLPPREAHLDILNRLAVEDEMFRHFYYEPAGDHMSNALYSIRHDIAAAVGREGLEEYLIEYGPLGNNGKGQKRALREYVLGLADRSGEGSSGYVAVVNDLTSLGACATGKPSRYSGTPMVLSRWMDAGTSSSSSERQPPVNRSFRSRAIAVLFSR